MKVSFTVESTRYFSVEGEKKAKRSRFNIEVFNKTAELCFKSLSKGRGVRVVGRLEEEGGKVWIIGESVEFKTKFDQKPGEIES